MFFEGRIRIRVFPNGQIWTRDRIRANYTWYTQPWFHKTTPISFDMNIKYHLKESLCVYGGPNRVAGGDDGEKEGGGRDGGRRSGTEYVTCMIWL